MIEALARYLESRTGLAFPEDSRGQLEAGLRQACQEVHLAPDDLTRLVLAGADPRLEQHLFSHLVVPETYFWREPDSLAAFEKVILPERLATGRRLRLWSAGCSTGEEAYSIAIAVQRAGAAGLCWILGTDLNQEALSRARSAVYKEWSLRSLPDWFSVYLREEDRSYRVCDEIRRQVSFSYLNLAVDPYPQEIDVIFCRNVLMYFTVEQRQAVLERFRQSLVPGGWLLVSACEANDEFRGKLEPVCIDGVTVYRNQTAVAPVPPDLRQDHQRRELPKRARRPPPQGGGREIVASSPAAEIRRLADSGQLNEALRACEAALKVQPCDPEFHYLLGLSLQEYGRSDEAAAAFSRVLYLDPDHIMAHWSLAALQREPGFENEADRHLAVAARLLERRERDEVLPHSGGLTCGRLLNEIRSAARCA